jgi:Glycosyltransferase like family 2
LPQADGAQAVSADDPQVTPVPQAQREDGASWPQFILYGVLVIVSLVLFAVAATTLWWMLHAWRSPDALATTGFRRRSARGPRSFSLLLPARHEQYVLGDTIDALARLDHPVYEVIVIIGHDDPETERVARAAAARHRRRVRVVIDDNIPKNKPKALNTALPACRGEIVGVFDAEDDVHPRLLRLVEGRFEESGADVVQAAQLAPDGPPGGTGAGPAVRLLHAAGATGSVRLALTPAAGEPTLLASEAQYGLITGYAPLPADSYDAVLTANGREWHRPAQLTGEPNTVVLTDGQDGPVLQQLRDAPDVTAPLDPPALTMPAPGTLSKRPRQRRLRPRVHVRR